MGQAKRKANFAAKASKVNGEASAYAEAKGCVGKIIEMLNDEISKSVLVRFLNDIMPQLQKKLGLLKAQNLQRGYLAVIIALKSTVEHAEKGDLAKNCMLQFQYKKLLEFLEKKEKSSC